MITDEELGRWARRYHEAFVTEEDNNRATEIALSLVADRAMPRLIAEVAYLRNLLGYDAQCAEQFRDENTALKAAVEQLRKEIILLQKKDDAEHGWADDRFDAAERLVDELMMGGRK